jgi:hypothetical protein
MAETNNPLSGIQQVTKAVAPFVVGGTEIVLIYLAIALQGVTTELEALNQRLHDLTYNVERIEKNRSP